MTAPDGAHVFRYSSSTGQLQDLGLVGDGSVSTWDLGFAIQGAFGREINSSGQVVGNYTNQGGLYGFRYTDTGGSGLFEDIGTLEGGMTYGSGIDDNGTVVGSSWVAGTPQVNDIRRLGHAVMFQNPIAGIMDMNDLIDPMLGWNLIQAIDIAGDYIVGTGELNGKLLPFRYRISTGIIEPISGGWAGFTYGNGVNRSGDVVGWGALDAAGTQFAAYAFSDRFGFKRLNEIVDPALGWDLRIATSINDAGMIVGPGTHAGVTAPYRLDLPVGESAICKARSTCGGDDGDAICLYSDGVAELPDGRLVAVFGFENASSATVQPTVNQVHLSGEFQPNPQPAPPAYLLPGTHTGAFLPTFASNEYVSWTVNGETVTARPTDKRLQTVSLGGGRVGVVIGGETIDLAAGPQDAVTPRLDGICQLTAGEYLAVFGYDNVSPQNVRIRLRQQRKCLLRRWCRRQHFGRAADLVPARHTLRRFLADILVGPISDLDGREHNPHCQCGVHATDMPAASSRVQCPDRNRPDTEWANERAASSRCPQGSSRARSSGRISSIPVSPWARSTGSSVSATTVRRPITCRSGYRMPRWFRTWPSTTTVATTTHSRASVSVSPASAR